MAHVLKQTVRRSGRGGSVVYTCECGAKLAYFGLADFNRRRQEPGARLRLYDRISKAHWQHRALLGLISQSSLVESVRWFDIAWLNSLMRDL